jgi:hypothetical protein
MSGSRLSPAGQCLTACWIADSTASKMATICFETVLPLVCACS